MAGRLMPVLMIGDRKVAEENKNFVLMDENLMGNHDYSGLVASDYNHLCETGAKMFTARLDSLLN